MRKVVRCFQERIGVLPECRWISARLRRCQVEAARRLAGRLGAIRNDTDSGLVIPTVFPYRRRRWARVSSRDSEDRTRGHSTVPATKQATSDLLWSMDPEWQFLEWLISVLAIGHPHIRVYLSIPGIISLCYPSALHFQWFGTSNGGTRSISDWRCQDCNQSRYGCLSRSTLLLRAKSVEWSRTRKKSLRIGYGSVNAIQQITISFSAGKLLVR